MNQAWLMTRKQQGFCQANRRVALGHSEKCCRVTRVIDPD